MLAGVSSFLPYLASVSLYTKCRCWSLSPKGCEVTWRSPAGCHMQTPHYLIISRSIRCTQPAIGTLLKVEDSRLSGSGTALGNIGFSRMLPLLPFSTFRTGTSIHPGPSPYTCTYAYTYSYIYICTTQVQALPWDGTCRWPHWEGSGTLARRKCAFLIPGCDFQVSSGS